MATAGAFDVLEFVSDGGGRDKGFRGQAGKFIGEVGGEGVVGLGEGEEESIWGGFRAHGAHVAGQLVELGRLGGVHMDVAECLLSSADDNVCLALP